MQYTPNYELPLYEPSDIANYLETYNNTITKTSAWKKNRKSTKNTKCRNGTIKKLI